MSSIFTRIINGELPCYKVAENESCFAFLDIQPLQKGHVLVVPKREVNKYFDLAPNELAELQHFAKKISYAIEQVTQCSRVGMSVIGLEVPHAHIHLIPINAMEDMNFANPKLNLESSELEQIAQDIREALI